MNCFLLSLPVGQSVRKSESQTRMLEEEKNTCNESHFDAIHEFVEVKISSMLQVI